MRRSNLSRDHLWVIESFTGWLRYTSSSINCGRMETAAARVVEAKTQFAVIFGKSFVIG
jgi:hypothetical protein